MGGVYYLDVPPGSAKLALIDPRGSNHRPLPGAPPLHAHGGAAAGATKRAMPAPPFHRREYVPMRGAVSEA